VSAECEGACTWSARWSRHGALEPPLDVNARPRDTPMDECPIKAGISGRAEFGVSLEASRSGAMMRTHTSSVGGGCRGLAATCSQHIESALVDVVVSIALRDDGARP
jgi:hypothetical protein